MGRPSAHTDTLLADIRAYYGLLQWELAGLLMMDEDVYRKYEADHRRLGAARTDRILPLLTVRPPRPAPLPGPTPTPPEPLPDPPPPGVGPAPKPDPLRDRLFDCRRHAARLRRAARPYAVRARYAARWAAAIPTLETTLPAAAPTPKAAAQALVWLHARPTALEPFELAEWHLLCARAAGLEAEAALLAALLGE